VLGHFHPNSPVGLSASMPRPSQWKHRIAIILSNFSFCVATSKPLSSKLGPVISVGYAAFAGNSTSPAGMVNSNVTFFGGISYAQPPVRELRWRAPKKLDEKNVDEPVVNDARNWGPPCLQWPANVGIGTEGMVLEIQLSQ
jgi:hypothetical protein